MKFWVVQYATEPSHAPDPVPIPNRLQTDLSDVVDHAARLAAGSVDDPHAWFVRLACAETATFKSLDVRQLIESAIRAHRPLCVGTGDYDLVLWPVAANGLPLGRRLCPPAVRDGRDPWSAANTGGRTGRLLAWTSFFELCDDPSVTDLESVKGISKELDALDELELPVPQKPPHFVRLEKLLQALQQLEGLSVEQHEQLAKRINGILDRFSASIAIKGTDRIATRLAIDDRGGAANLFRLSIPQSGNAGFKRADIEVVASKSNRRKR